MARILVIDDDEIVRDLLRTVLQDHGYGVVEAADGEAGAQLYRDEPTDLVITDIFMPVKEGLEMIRELRRDFPGVKIIAISGAPRGSFDPLPVAMRFGALCALSKPFDLKELLGAVKKALRE